MKESTRPVTSAARTSEVTVRAVLLGVGLSALLAAANAYLGLFAGMTVSASIPAAVLSMGILRAVRGSILENNLVQTAASAGEAAAAGAIFTLPALLLLGAWTRFPWLDCTLLVATGGTLGVVFTIFLRKPLIVDGELPFPEGVATAQVLLAGHRQLPATTSSVSSAEDSASSASKPIDPQLRSLLIGGMLGAGYKVLESGVGVIRPAVEWATRIGGGTLYLGTGTSPALVAVGYIVGLRIAFLICVGGLINWLLVIPWLVPEASGAQPLELVWSTWSQQTRYLGVGAMTFSGLFTVVELRRTIGRAALQGWASMKVEPDTTTEERDLSIRWIVFAVAVVTGILVWMFSRYLPSIALSMLITLAVIGIAFVFSAVAAYMAGLLGSSNNPVSGVTIATVIIISLILVAAQVEKEAGAIATIFVASVVCTAAAIGGDNVQDLKAGHLLHASPVRQQVLQLLGVFAAAVVLGPVLQLLSDSYGFGEPNAVHPQPLLAPQATLMAAVAQGMFGGELPFRMIACGLGLGVLFASSDFALKQSGARFRAPPLALSLGLYLPLQLSVPVLIGGLVAHVSQSRSRRAGQGGTDTLDLGVLLGAGLITGEALLGVLLAGVVFWAGSTQSMNLGWSSVGLSLAALAVFALSLLRRRGT